MITSRFSPSSAMSCCLQSRKESSLVGLAPKVSSPSSRHHQVVNQQPQSGPQLHHPAIPTHAAHHGSSLSWSSMDSPPLPSLTPNYGATHYDDGYFPTAGELGTVNSHGRSLSQTFDEGKLVIAIDFGTIYTLPSLKIYLLTGNPIRRNYIFRCRAQ
jgi:hypothetical protein